MLRNEMWIMLTAIGLVLTSASASAGTYHVPGDYPDPQTALLALHPGDTLVIHGGTWAPISITKPVTIVGDPAVVFQSSALLGSTMPPCITLSGGGSGTVSLQNVTTAGFTNFILTSQISPAIVGGGFEGLNILRSTIRPPTWTGVSGVAFGAAALDVAIPSILISSSLIEASDSDIDTTFFSVAPGFPAIAASASTVTLLDSTVHGGDASRLNLFPGSEISPCPCSGWGGKGGAGVIAQKLFLAASQITGGSGALVFQGGFPWGQQQDGPPTVVGFLKDLGSSLSSTGPIHIGQSWTVGWTTPSAQNGLILSGNFQPPTLLPGIGYSFSDYSNVHFAQIVPGGAAQSMTFQIPANSALVGLIVVAELYDPIRGFTRPIVEPVVF